MFVTFIILIFTSNGSCINELYLNCTVLQCFKFTLPNLCLTKYMFVLFRNSTLPLKRNLLKDEKQRFESCFLFSFKVDYHQLISTYCKLAAPSTPGHFWIWLLLPHFGRCHIIIHWHKNYKTGNFAN